MIPAILIGREGSKRFHNKNIHKVLNRYLMEYPIINAKLSKQIDMVYVSTDSDKIKEIGIKHKCKIIDRPPELCTDESRNEAVFKHAYDEIRKENDIEMIILLMCNAPMITTDMINDGIRVLRNNPSYDSAISVSRYNMFSPIRARKITNGLLEPFVPFEYMEGYEKFDSDRDSQGDCWFADMGVSIIRPRCLDDIENGLLPQKWMGKKIYPLEQEGGFDVDYEWEIPLVEDWLVRHGWSKR